jgi:ABC-type antimicrobial peptide transport system permease subunit
MVLRLDANKNIQQNLQTASAILKKYNPAYPFTYHFVDEEYGLKFKDQQQTATLAALFGGLAIFISCLGLFGLASFMAESRIKEIGIRKVLGASSARLAALLSTDLLKLVGVSCLIAFPVAWWLMSDWLKGYSYRISMKWKLFLIAGGMALLIALITVSFQAIKAAIANPVKSLRTE